MDYRRMNDIYYVRIDKGEEIITELLQICGREGIQSAVFTGIGGCSHAEIQTFIPQKGTFETEKVDFICEANGYDAEKIGQHFLEILPKICPKEG